MYGAPRARAEEPQESVGPAIDSALVRAVAATNLWARTFTTVLSDGSVSRSDMETMERAGLPSTFFNQEQRGGSATIASVYAAASELASAVDKTRAINVKGLRSFDAVAVSSSSPHFVLKYAQYLSKRLKEQAREARCDGLPSVHVKARVACFDRAGVALENARASAKVCSARSVCRWWR